jgi:hypothetical protein
VKILLVTSVDPWTRSVSTIHKWVAAGRRLGYEIAVFGKPNQELPELPLTTDLSCVDLALFIVQLPLDFPDMPHLAHVLDGIPRERRVVLDLWGHFNDTIRVEHDFNHLEKFDGHLGWEWEDAIRSVSSTILQPTLAPRRSGVGSFLFHGFDPGSVVKAYKTAREAADAWNGRPYGAMYVGSNWQRWDQVRQFLESYGIARGKIGQVCLVGWDWAVRPEWAVRQGILGNNTDPGLLANLDVEVRDGVRFDEVVSLLGNAYFAPVFHRPLFQHLGFVTNRTFETFYADSLPILMLPRDFVEAVYGESALRLVPGDDLLVHLMDAWNNPEIYWDAVLRTRAYLAKYHSYEHRIREIVNLGNVSAPSGAAC